MVLFEWSNIFKDFNSSTNFCNYISFFFSTVIPLDMNRSLYMKSVMNLHFHHKMIV